jgi:hypothetical protein
MPTFAGHPFLGTWVGRAKKNGRSCLTLLGCLVPPRTLLLYDPFSAARQLSAAQLFRAARREASVVGGALAVYLLESS